MTSHPSGPHGPDLDKPQPGGAYAPGHTPNAPDAHADTDTIGGARDRGAADEARARAGGMADEAAATADEARSEAAQVAARLREQGQRVRDEAGERLRAIVDDQRAQLAGEVDALALALRGAADELGRDDHRMAACGVEVAAHGLRSVTASLNRGEAREFVDDVAGFARREPALFIGGTVLAGFLLGRFLQSTANRDHDRHASGAVHGQAGRVDR